MLRHHRLPTKRTLRLLPNPIPDTRPAKHMPARGHARIAHRLQTQRAFPLLLALHPRHHSRLLEIVARLLRVQDGGVCRFLDAVVHPEQVVVARVFASAGADLHAAVDDRAAACC